LPDSTSSGSPLFSVWHRERMVAPGLLHKSNLLDHTDSDRTQFNYSGILGNSTAVAISNAYYQDNRSAADSATKLGVQIGVDMASNVLKEFWPDVSRRFSRKNRQ